MIIGIIVGTKRITCAVILVILVAASGCGSAVKGKSHYKVKRSSCSLDQLVGDDTYFYSDKYQRKLKKSITNRTLFH